ncbi:cell division topological specificity factor MinE [Proteiniborus ethanoligenes]|uniref:Cell division topological specificity factor n=1 Tax=Proteiniborus ethanoligenes TaxID=415015 RepID=A0A1H3SHF5_9FIRM|nr:cell division topological specificity factor MinE [Proteiniborus ethanoligenes]TAH63583.1 MAG: cell division topological specificity factor MinE [Gottschalkiaceae bacterium]SDZ37138.1 cell division topological specificity factor MinE [Proteiniborus ethanoligenes]
MDLFKLFGRSDNKSKNVAKERLKLVLIHDRANISPHFLEILKGDIIRVISDYMVIDEEGLDIKLTRTRRESDNTPIPALIANIPILKMKEGSMK